MRRTATTVLAALLMGGCFSPKSSAGEIETADATDATTGAGSTETDSVDGTTTGIGPGETTIADSASATSDTESGGETTSSATSTGDTTSNPDDTSGSSGEEVFEPCPQLVEDFDVCPGEPWEATGAGDVACAGGDAVLTVTSESDGIVSLVLPVGLVDATAVVELGDAPPSGMLKMLRIRTPGPRIIAFRINVNPEGQATLEAYVDIEGSTEVLASMAHDPTAHRWVSVREEAEMLTFETSEDGVTFSPFHTAPAPFDLTEATVGIAASNFVELAEDTPTSFGRFEYYCAG